MRLRLLAALFALVSVLALATLRTSAQDPASAPWVNDLAPIAPADWNYARAAHLIERAGFGAPPDEVARLAKLTPAQAVNELVDYQTIRQDLPPFDESLIWDPGMDPFPPSRAEAVRIARERGAGLGEPVLPAGTQRRLQPVVDKFFYSLIANGIETQRLGLWWAEPHAGQQAAARREADALLARALRDRPEQGAGLPHDAAAERALPGQGFRAVPRPARRPARRIRRCSCISTTARTSRAIPTKTSAASCWSSSRWAWVTTRSATYARPPAPSPGGPTTCCSSSSTRRSTTPASRPSLAKRVRSTVKTSSTRSCSSR